MLTTSLYKPQAMDVAMPDISDPAQYIDFADKRTMTIILGEQHKVHWYWGLLDNPIEGPKITEHGKFGIRTEILDKIDKVNSMGYPVNKSFMVIIRPSDRSDYSGLVNILDEMKINNVQQYMIADVSQEEIALLQKDDLKKK